jgi:hypothetical protein
MRFREANFLFWKAWPGNWWNEETYDPGMHWKAWCMGGEL